MWLCVCLCLSVSVSACVVGVCVCVCWGLRVFLSYRPSSAWFKGKPQGNNSVFGRPPFDHACLFGASP